jgi:hypothetical protein
MIIAAGQEGKAIAILKTMWWQNIDTKGKCAYSMITNPTVVAQIQCEYHHHFVFIAH